MYANKIEMFRAIAIAFMLVTAANILFAAPNVSAATVQVLCDGQTFDGYTSTPFKLDGGSAADANVQKVIRNCTFTNSKVPGITLRNANNVLIENNTFSNIRTRQPGVGVHGINAACATQCIDITVRGNKFKQIGADGIQIGDTGRKVVNFIIEQNTFIGTTGTGENAVDIKGADGPIIIRGNLVKGFRPCVSPKKGGTQDCSGSPGEGIVLHRGRAAGAPGNLTVEDNTFEDNVFGLSVSRTLPNVVVRNNKFMSNLKTGLLVSNADEIRAEYNTFDSNPKHISVKNTSPCTLVGNTYSNGTPLATKGASCTQQ